MKKLILLLFLASSQFSINTEAALPLNIPSDAAEQAKEINELSEVHKRSHLNKKLVNRRLGKKMEGDNKTAAIVFAVLIPFVGVAIYQDRIGRDFWITLLLTLLLYVPGLIYALSIVLKRTR